MSKKSIIVLSALLASGAALGLATFTGYGQGRPRSVEPRPLTKNEAIVVPVRTAPTVSVSASNPFFLQAASQNAVLKNGLEWLFGGKQQHGWYLYNSLIARLVSTDKDPNSPDFAVALASWQRTAGVSPTGILDSDTLYKMVETWQAVRSKDHSYPTPDQLVTVSPSEFLYPERPAELRQVRIDAYAAYRRMLSAAIADPELKLRTLPNHELAPEERFLKLVSTFRSREYQEQLRRQSPNAGRAGLAVNSPHFTGRALDIYVGGDPVDTSDFNRAIQVNTPVYRWLVKNAEKFGFYPYYYEPWHWEYKPQQ